MRGAPGFFDVDDRLRRLSDLGDQLEAFGRAVDFEIFRADLAAALGYRSGPQGGRPPFDAVMMFKVLVIQAANNLSDERTEFLINDRLSFMRFLELGLSDRVPDARTIWLFREKLSKAGAIKGLFERFDATLRAAGYIAMSGQIIDASLVAAPKQRNTDDEKRTIRDGGVPAPAEGPGCPLDGQVLQGQAAAGRHEAAPRHRHSLVRLPEPCRHRPGLRPDPDVDGDRRCRL
jgi:IS5 family transposase